MAKTKYSARINGEHIDGTIEIIKRIVLHLHDMGKTQFNAPRLFMVEKRRNI